MTLTIKSAKRVVESKQLPLPEFWYLAKELEAEPFNTLRQLGKGSNFGLLFGAGARTFANSYLTNLSIKEATEIVEFLNLRQLQRTLVQSGKLKGFEIEDPYFLDRFAIASYIRDEFRKAYPGLVKLAERRRDEATSKGYVRSEFGPVRRLPEMFLAGAHDDRISYSTAINSPVQTYEAVVATYYTGYQLWKWLKDNNMRSRIWTFVHDSMDLYIHKDEAEVVVAKVKELAERALPEHKGILITVSGSLADYYGRGEIWKTGLNMNEFLPKTAVHVQSSEAVLIKKRQSKKVVS